MPTSVTRRRYESPHRRKQAEATRRAVLDAARTLFVERGYVATTVNAIAARAGVSSETVYSAFGTKRTLLASLVDAPIAGDDDGSPGLDRAWVRRLRAEADPRRRLLILAREGVAILRRRSAMDEVVRGAAAADPEIAAAWDRGRRDRFAAQRRLLELVVGDTRLRRRMDLEQAAAVLYSIGSPETYRLLVADRGWTDARFERWFAETLDHLLFDNGDPPGAGR